MPIDLSQLLEQHASLFAGLSVLSLLLLAATVFATPWLIGRLPSDYFARTPQATAERGVRRLALLLLRNVAGVLFMTIGLIMMVTPGPGIVGLLLGLSVCDFPGKQALVRRLAAQPRVFQSLNWIRRRRQKPGFQKPRLD